MFEYPRGVTRARRPQCELCGKCFRREDHLKRHALNHDIPRFSCTFPNCAQRFHRRDVQRRHTESHLRETSDIRQLDEAAESGLLNPEESLDQPSFDDPFLFDLFGTPAGLDLDVSHTPSNEQFTELSDHTSTQTISECVSLYGDYEAIRLPFIHRPDSQTDEGLQHAMAALGALHSDTHKHLASHIHEATKTLISTDTSGVSRLQSRILAIEFAIWSRNILRRQWAINEMISVSHDLRHSIDSISNGNASWQAWLEQETLRRAAFAFYNIATTASAFLGAPIIFKAQDLPLNLPCVPSIWKASTEDDWNDVRNGSGSWPASNNFPQALHALIRRDSIHDYGLEMFSAFDQYIMLCAILEMFTTAKSVIGNYDSHQDWRAMNMGTFKIRGELNETLDMCRSLWWASAESLWQSDARSHPQEENIMLLQYLYIAVNGAASIGSAEYQAYQRPAVQAAVDIFASCSKCGFKRVANTCRTTISRPGRHTALTSANVLRAWARYIGGCNEQLLDQHDQAVLLQVRQACRRGMHEGIIEDMNNVEISVTTLWCTMLGVEWV